MCGRFTLTSNKQKIYYSFPYQNLPEFKPSYNIAPTQSVLAVIENKGEFTFKYLYWGLIPKWAKDQKIASKMINARAETITEKPSFRDSFRQRRCLIIADGFYEWNQDLYKKQPLYFHLENHQPFAFAGLWDSWRSPSGKIIESATIINTQANQIMQLIHPRMPVILARENQEIWLNHQQQDFDNLESLLASKTTVRLSYYPVDEAVNFVQNNYPELLNPKTIHHPQQLSLF